MPRRHPSLHSLQRKVVYADFDFDSGSLFLTTRTAFLEFILSKLVVGSFLTSFGGKIFKNMKSEKQKQNQPVG